MASSSTCHVTKIKHDVFISFRGTDVRKGLLSHLKKELRRRQIDTYVDERLDRGDEISSSLLTAIEGSQILLVIFSKDYASSKWCLEELAKMIECMERNKQIVLPVFFNVDPSHVRHQHGEYGHALAKHEETLKENVPKVQSWRAALEKTAHLSGFHYPTNFEDESDLVDKIVEDITKKLSKFCPSESNGLVGIDQNIAQIQSLLIMESSEVVFLGIWGMGGIGKTTIARAIFDVYSPKYDGCCFLNVREELEKHGLSLLRERLISELLEGESLLHTSGTCKERFFNFALRRMGQKKVLVVFDDVNATEQLKYLVGEPIWFGTGSIVIITSRDKQVLTSGGVHQIHKVKEMDPRDSLKLFCLNAFNESQPKMGYEKLSEEVVKIAQGNPLALKVLGSDFHSRRIDTWECALSKIKKYPNQRIQSVLRFSYDGLHDVDKKAFLDIAFFFEDDDEDYVIRQLDSWGFYGATGIEILEQKALITISDNRIQMHDLIREMGCEIVRQESIKYQGRRSRLRDNEEVFDVLRCNLGTYVEAMQIDVSQITDLHLKVDTLKKMPRLRFLKFYLPLHAKLSMPPSHDGPIWSPEKQDALLLSAGCRELMRVASEIHIKCFCYLLIDGCSDPSLLNKLLITSGRLQELARCGVEIISNSSIGHFNNLECSDVVDQQFKNMPNEISCLRSTYYLKLSKRTRQDNGKPKLYILFDGSRYYQRIAVGQFSDSIVPAARAISLTYYYFLLHQIPTTSVFIVLSPSLLIDFSIAYGIFFLILGYFTSQSLPLHVWTIISPFILCCAPFVLAPLCASIFFPQLFLYSRLQVHLIYHTHTYRPSFSVKSLVTYIILSLFCCFFISTSLPHSPQFWNEFFLTFQDGYFSQSFRTEYFICHFPLYFLLWKRIPEFCRHLMRDRKRREISY